MSIKIGQFELALCGGIYICVPLIGAAFIGRGLTAFDRWSVVRTEGRGK